MISKIKLLRYNPGWGGLILWCAQGTALMLTNQPAKFKYINLNCSKIVTAKEALDNWKCSSFFIKNYFAGHTHTHTHTHKRERDR